MLFTSRHRPLTLPPEETILPHFLLEQSKTQRTSEPLLYPPPKKSPFSASRPHASALSLDDVRQKAYKTAKAILEGAMNGNSSSSSSSFSKGDVVAIYSPSQHDYIAIILGIHLVGGVAALCNPSYKARELAHQLRMTKSRCIITTSAESGKSGETPLHKAKEAIRLACSEDDEKEAGGFEKLQREPALYVFEEKNAQGWDGASDKYTVDDAVTEQVNEKSKEVRGNDAAIYCFSSGTSGLPKAVILTHSNLVANTIQATFLLHDRMNEPLSDGKEYSKEGKTGWYDEAHKRGAGRDAAAESQSDSMLESGTSHKRKVEEVIENLKSKLSFHEKQQQQQQQHQNGMERIEKRSEDQQEFHIDVLPQFHCYGLLVNLVALHTCTPRIILPRFQLETYLQSIADHGVTFGFVVPPILLALAKDPLVDQYDISSLWRVASGAASLPDEIADEVHTRLGILCTDGYGMTEMSPIISLQTVSDLEEAPKSVGALAPSTQALVLDSDGKELGPNEAGELLLRGPQMMKGYLENDQANKDAFYKQPGDGEDEKLWLRTGDVVKIDERGYITITDRLKDVIKAKGFQVSPAELEAILFKDARIVDVAVTGVRDTKDGAEKPWAFIVAHKSAFEKGTGIEDAEKDEVAKSILQKVNGQVAGYKKIEGVTWLEALPKSDSGKVLKKELKASEY